MAKKMSVEEMLAAARAEKQKKGDAPAAPTAPPAEESAAAAASSGEKPAPSAGAKAPPGGKGMSIADIMAAARAGKGGGAPAPAAPKSEAKAAPAPKPAAEKPVKKAPAAEAAPAEKDTASILAAARKESRPGPVSKAEAAEKGIETPRPGKVKLEVPPMPARPQFARPAANAEVDATRRGFLAGLGAACSVFFGSWLSVGFTSLAATTAVGTLGLARYMFPNILTEPPTKFKVGFPDNFGPGQVETKFIPQFGVWVVRYEYEGQPMIYALKAVCTHLGCTPSWLEAEQKYKCPCHGSGFYKDGVNFEGPAPRPLERYAISLADDGQLEVDKSRTFNQELGQWKDSASYVVV